MSKFDNMNMEQMKEYYNNQMLDYYQKSKGKANGQPKVVNRRHTYDPNDYELAVPVMESMTQQEAPPRPQQVIPQTRQAIPTPATPTPAPPQSTASIEEQYQQFARDFPAKGMLKAQAFTARRTYPVENVTVEISKKFGEEKYVIATLKTNIAGQTEAISLHTVDKNLSEAPSTEKPFVTYDLKATHPNFMTANYYNIPIFDGIISTQAIDLVPMAAAPEGMTESSFYERQDDL
ncbi:hypothetical protein RBG61_04125 [Paludicola sp. MB14-C6]|uniref:hypothetical protein n=1 Tax=Paludihabitans sp. MB14-C6 TaxID=3070656 RepID=UPI0027DD27EC|nr:hypothetical protein [Paludicola sp. MB14-C6]WMJ23861.1 hypothetical protein RBG61_04125 [Paludicola sp. MB14-C6]